MRRWSSRSSRGLLAAWLALVPGEVLAGACCTGSMTTVPTRLGECERAIAGLGAAMEASVARSDATWRPRASSLAEQAIVTTVAGAWRWDRKGQIGLSVPFRATHRAAGDTSSWGGGIGDLRAWVVLDPVEERPRGAGKALPAPVFVLGVRAPTGRSWERSADPLMSDVTGLPGAAVTAAVQLERTLDRVPWSVSLGTEVGASRSGVQPSLTGAAMVGATVGRSWSVLASVQHLSSWAPDDTGGHHAARTTAGLRVVHGQLLRWRAWAGVDVDLPWLGRDRPLVVAPSAGVALVR